MKRHLSEIWSKLIAWHVVGPGLNVAIRAAVTLAVPLLILAVTDHLEWALYAGFGAFAALYARFEGYAGRFWTQLSAGVTLVVAMLIGTLLSVVDAPVVVRIIVVGLTAAVVTSLAAGWAWSPPGPIFPLFALGATASVPATASGFLLVLAIGGGTVLFSLVIVLALALRRVKLRTLTPAAMPFQRERVSHSHSAIIGGGVVLAGFVAEAVLDSHWYWACIACVAALTGATVHARIARGLQRVIGTALGVLLAAGLFSIEAPVWVLLVTAIICLAITELIVMSNYAVAMILITVNALIMVHLSSPEPPAQLVSDRLMETGLGVLVGIVCAVVVGTIGARRDERVMPRNG